MKTIYNTIKYSFTLALVCIGLGTMAQTFSPGDTVCLYTSYRGAIQWQKSTDSTNWTPISGGTSDTMCFVANSSGWYRAMITEGTCNPVYSDTTMIQVKVSQLYTQNDTFVVPPNITSVRVLVVGGGGGGSNGHQGGGGSGYVKTGTYSVTPGQKIPVIVGKGGNGGQQCSGCNTIIGLTKGDSSHFGGMLSAGGGLVVTGINQTGNNGGCGGGGSCNSGTNGGDGGTGGTNGTGCTYAGGIGQGSYTASLTMFVNSTVTAGTGGLGGSSSHSGGGGGGGILINSSTVNGQDGAKSWSGKGGAGYGAGGGGGGYDSSSGSMREAGGNGAVGVVYVEW